MLERKEPWPKWYACEAKAALEDAERETDPIKKIEAIRRHMIVNAESIECRNHWNSGGINWD